MYRRGAYLEEGFYVGEALVGSGYEVAHIDLVIGSKRGAAGIAFVNALSQLSAGHTPMLAVIRPNLPTKPNTVIVPKVTVKTMEDADKIFGPAQAAVAKAVADAVEEGLIPRDKCEDWVVIASVFIHPKAKDYRKIYQYNYGATKLAIRRALKGYPSAEKVLKEKDRAVHPIMGFKVRRLWNPPYLQVALDLRSVDRALEVVKLLPKRERLILEAGTPLIKAQGVGVVEKIRSVWRDAFIVADLKTMDVGRVEVKEAADATADAVCILAVASDTTVDKAILEAQKQGIYSVLDMMEVSDPIARLERLTYKPDIVLLHVSADVERAAAEAGKPLETRWGNISEIKKRFRVLVAVAGGVTPATAGEALRSGADIIVVGRYIVRNGDPRRAAEQFLDLMPPDPDTMRLILDEDERVGEI
ncbi:bifunctional 5,6,7,8-tetrahydromethanopterin hydro-lyase/3-hexulose-6-phosphate synthase [Candidatus Bathyarchaeota archaeon]|nr:bifunctional 5,6,7,8-tetrahydromethanopterin hydro-lyase/3-hexulose-6-phosphate synthase [Candidatus Bathyarchaeota archaeon]